MGQTVRRQQHLRAPWVLCSPPCAFAQGEPDALGPFVEARALHGDDAEHDARWWPSGARRPEAARTAARRRCAHLGKRRGYQNVIYLSKNKFGQVWTVA